MDCYEIWVNLRPGVKDLEFHQAVEAYCGYLKDRGLLESHRVRLRKLGFGPEELGLWNITLEFTGMAQMDQCFNLVATRTGEVEALHAAVYSKVCDFRAGLYRDFPDPVRGR